MFYAGSLEVDDGSDDDACLDPQGEGVDGQEGDGEYTEMSPHERMDSAVRLKDQGNGAFEGTEFTTARTFYKSALTIAVTGIAESELPPGSNALRLTKCFRRSTACAGQINPPVQRVTTSLSS